MYLKLEIDGEESFHSFPNKKSITIGRATTNDLQVMAEGVSRVHLEVKELSSGEFFVVDKGSTKGTFINEEPIESEKEVAFNTFFPARLGPSVLVYLVDESVTHEEEVLPIEDEMKSDFEHEEKPKKIQATNPHIHIPSTVGQVTDSMQNLLAKKNDVTQSKVKNSKKPTKKSDNKNKTLIIVVLFGFLAVVGYQKWEEIQEKKLLAIKAKKEQEALELAQKQAELLKEQEQARAKEKEREFLRQQEYIKNTVTKDKCLMDIELAFCQILKNKRSNNYYEGVLKELNTLYMVLDINKNQFNDYQYTEDEKKFIIAEASKSIGRGFHPAHFERQQKLMLPELVDNFENNNLLAFADFLLSFSEGLPQITDEIVKLTIVAAKEGVYLSHYEYDLEKLKKLKLDTIKKEAMALRKSHITLPLQRLLLMYKYQPPSVTQEKVE